MATNRVFAGNEKNNTFGLVPDETVSGDAVWWGDTPAVAITDPGGATKEIEVGSLKIEYPSGGQGLAAGEASLATDGTYDLPLTVTPASPPANGTVVYSSTDPASEEVTLTLDADDGDSPAVPYTRFGVINAPKDYTWTATAAPVRIGA